jgi:hypothetical protein
MATVRLLCVDNTTKAVTQAYYWNDYTKTSATVSGLIPGHSYGFIVQTFNNQSINGASSEQIFLDNASPPYIRDNLFVGYPLTWATPNP